MLSVFSVSYSDGVPVVRILGWAMLLWDKALLLVFLY